MLSLNKFQNLLLLNKKTCLSIFYIKRTSVSFQLHICNHHTYSKLPSDYSNPLLYSSNALKLSSSTFPNFFLKFPPPSTFIVLRNISSKANFDQNLNFSVFSRASKSNSKGNLFNFEQILSKSYFTTSTNSAPVYSKISNESPKSNPNVTPFNNTDNQLASNLNSETNIKSPSNSDISDEKIEQIAEKARKAEELWNLLVPERKMTFSSPLFWILLIAVIVLHFYNNHREKVRKIEDSKEYKLEQIRKLEVEEKRRKRIEENLENV